MNALDFDDFQISCTEALDYKLGVFDGLTLAGVLVLEGTVEISKRVFKTRAWHRPMERLRFIGAKRCCSIISDKLLDMMDDFNDNDALLKIAGMDSVNEMKESDYRDADKSLKELEAMRSEIRAYVKARISEPVKLTDDELNEEYVPTNTAYAGKTGKFAIQ